MKRSLLFLGVAAAGVGLIAGSIFSFWLEERRADRDWILANRHPRPVLR
jgi:hypothetical protein